MVRICFLGMNSFIEKATIDRMRTALVSICEKENEIEFWLHGSHFYFEKLAVNIILSLKEDNPQKRISIVDVVDPIKSEKLNTVDIQEKADGFPEGVTDRFEYAPRYEDMRSEGLDRFILRSQRVDSWMRRQCDYLIAYNYNNLPDSINTFVKRAESYPSLTVIHIELPSTLQKIDELIDRLEGRDKLIVGGLRDGRSYSDIARELGISHNRVKQIASRVARDIRLKIEV